MTGAARRSHAPNVASQWNRIAVIGNGGGGKTTLARELSRKLELPLTHVDSIQYLAGMKVRDRAETSSILEKVAAGDRWLIDGFGALEVMQRRFNLAELVIYVDFPLWRHYWWCLKRQMISLRAPRAELPDGCNEATLAYTIELFKTLWRVHAAIKPKLEELFARPERAGKVVRVANMKDWRQVFRGELAAQD